MPCFKENKNSVCGIFSPNIRTLFHSMNIKMFPKIKLRKDRLEKEKNIEILANSLHQKILNAQNFCVKDRQANLDLLESTGLIEKPIDILTAGFEKITSSLSNECLNDMYKNICIANGAFRERNQRCFSEYMGKLNAYGSPDLFKDTLSCRIDSSFMLKTANCDNALSKLLYEQYFAP